MKSIFLTQEPHLDLLDGVYSPRMRKRLADISEFLGTVCRKDQYDSPMAREAEAAFSTWGIPALTEEELDKFPNLKAVFYGAGSVQGFARPLLKRGIRLFGAWQANAVPVAEFSFAQITLAMKGYFQLTRMNRRDALAMFAHYPGNYESKVGIVGCGAIGKRVAKKLRDLSVEVWVHDPYLKDETARELGVRKAELRDLFRECDVIDNHLPDLPATRGMLTRELFMSMKPYATFINTARAAQLNENDLYDALCEAPTRTALLDVMADESPDAHSPLADLANVFMTPHIAGAYAQERWRLAEYMLDEYQRMEKGEACPYEITLEMLKTMA